MSLPFILAFSLAREQVMVLLGVYNGTTDRIVSMISSYLLWFAPSVIPLYLTPVLHPLMQFDGDSGRSPAAIMISLIVNIIGDIICVLLLGKGMEGIAFATTLSCFTECAVLMLHFRKEDAVLRPLGLSGPGCQKGIFTFFDNLKDVLHGRRQHSSLAYLSTSWRSVLVERIRLPCLRQEMRYGRFYSAFRLRRVIQGFRLGLFQKAKKTIGL